MAEGNGNRNTPPLNEPKDKNPTTGKRKGPDETRPTDVEILNDIKDLITTHQEQLTRIRNEIKAKNKESQDLDRKIDDKKKNYEKINKDLSLSEKRLQETEQTHRVLSDEIKKLQETHKLNRELQFLVTSQTQKIENSKREITELKIKCTRIEKELSSKTEKLNAVTNDLQTKTGQHNLFKSQMETALKKVNENLQTQQRNVITRDKTIETLQQEVTMLQGHVTQLQVDGQQFKDAYESETYNHNLTKADLELCMTELAQKNGEKRLLKSHDRELEFLENEVYKAKIETSEIHIKYRELTDKFARVESSNDTLREENVDLQEQLKEIRSLQYLISNLREQNHSLSSDKERLEASNMKNANRYREQVCHYGQQTDELKGVQTELVKYKHRVQQNTNEVECLKGKLKEAYDKIEALEKDLAESLNRESDNT